MSLFTVFVNKDADISFGMLTHNTLFPPAVPVPTPALSVEMVAFQKWLYGFVMNQNKLTTTVKHVGQGIVLSGHDCGMLIPDITPPVFVNAWYAVCWPFSSRKITFAASTVKMDGQPVGCAQMGPVPLPMMTCGDPVSAPTALFMFNCFTSQVRVGMSLKDLMMGLLEIAVSIAIDLIFEKVGGNSMGDVAKGYGRSVTRQGVREGAQEAVEKATREAIEEGTEYVAKDMGQHVAEGLMDKIGATPQEALKRGVSSLAGLGTSALQGDPTFKYGVGAPWQGAELGIDSEGAVLQGNYMGAQGDTRGESALWGESL
jgi:hypothetical protein